MLDSELDIEMMHDDEAVVLIAHGAIDYRSAPRFLAAMYRAILAGRRRVVIDLTGVEVIDAEGSSALASATRAASDNGVKLQTTGLPATQLGSFSAA
ncbi:MAG TPA: STAS domain-containing protein [Acidimicrobiales bacterium]|jgi:anti-anti-sigma factor|nr:STAS domain-containing protein [Acidimicrobiales bacterium]